MLFKSALFALAMFAAPIAHAEAPSPVPTPEQERLLLDVQEDVNNKIKFVAESGTNDDWEIPTRSGDCEDFALLKRQELIARGWNADDLKLILVYRTVIDDDTGTQVLEGHAVLWVKSINYVLDAPMTGTKSVIYPEFYKTWAHHGGWKFKCVFGDLSLGDHHRPVTERCEAYGKPE